MTFDFKLPELGENIEQAEVVKVLAAKGDKVEVDQILIEIETDKATIEVPAEKEGIVTSVKVKDGDTIKVGQTIFEFDDKTSDAEKKEEVKPEIESPIKEAEKKNDLSTSEKKVEESKSEIIEFKLPELGENIETADIIKILVNTGDKIKADEILFEIETDKATVEVPSEFSGTIKEIKAKEGDTVNVGDVILVIDGSGKNNETAKPQVEIDSKPKTEKEEVKTIKKIEQPGQTETKSSVPLPKEKFTGKIAPAAPSVRRFAREIGIDINEISGSGPSGRISINDVKKFAKSFNEKIRSGGSGMPIGIKREKLPDFSKWGTIRKESMSNIRKKTAEHLSFAWTTIPHVTQFDKADITELEKLRKQFGKKVEISGGKLTITSILMKIIASALKVFPQFNSSIDMDNMEIIYKEYFNVGIAVDTPKGLIVPVVRDVDKKNIIELSKDLTDISLKARDKKVTIEDMQGASFTISNLGGIGGTYFTPIVNSPEVAILGVSRGKFEAVYKDGEFVPRLMLPLSLSYDHRIIDGADAARFIRWIVEALEQPFLLSLEG